MSNERKLWWKVRPAEGGAWLYTDKLGNFTDVLGDGDDAVRDGDAYELYAVMMTQAEIDALPEWDGW